VFLGRLCYSGRIRILLCLYANQKRAEIMEKCFSTNDEDFNHTEFSELMEALKDNGDVAVGTVYYEADFRHITGKDLVDASRLIEDMEERLYDEVGECAEGGLDVSNEAAEELEEFLVQWAEKHTDLGRFYKIIGKSREMKVTEADLADNA